MHFQCYNNIYKTKPADKESMAAQELLNRVLPTYLPL